KECLRLADRDLNTLTGLLEARVVAGGAKGDGRRLIDEARTLAATRPELVTELLNAARVRRLRPGPVAEMLEPNLKEGAGGLRDVQSLVWAGWTLGGAGGLAALTQRGALLPGDAEFLDGATALLLDVRIGLHRVTGGRSDVLALQDHDAVAELLGYEDADALVRAVAAAARRVAWLTNDALSRFPDSTAARARFGRIGRRNRATGSDRGDELLPVVDGRLMLGEGDHADVSTLLRLSRVAAERGVAIDRAALVAFRDVGEPEWTAGQRDDFLAILRSGAAMIDVFLALDHEDLVSRILPEWAEVRFRPQRNAYHRFTVDRHLIETVAEVNTVLAEATGVERDAADSLEHPDLLLLGALLHDIAKGQPGDHAVVGARTAREIAARLGYREPEEATLEWLVLDHLLIADTATRRDLSDPVTIARAAERVATPERLRLLTLLTIADSRATGPAAWGPGKAALVRELYERTLAALTGSEVMESLPDADLPIDELEGVDVVVVWEHLDDDQLRCSVGAPDRPGMLARVAGALSLEGFDIASAEGHSLAGGRAAEVFVGTDRFDRLRDGPGRDRADATIRRVLAGEVAVAAALDERREVYAQSSDQHTESGVRIRIAQDESHEATVVEVFAPDEIGLLATIASVFGTLGLDVRVARAATTGEQAVDVFYIQDAGRKVTDVARVA
ncbi:MAG: ACT domain-containing protein, partial [Acidimicrobiia bacterium]|nr:ACT domain-containing protein [Acidimicrobiia bacterium]